MSYPQLIIRGYSEAAMFMQSAPKGAVMAIISIHGRRERGVSADVPHRLDLLFDDVDSSPRDEVAILALHARQKSNEQNGLVEIAPTEAAAQRIIDFAESVRDVEGIVLCHCGAGVSRAPAAALICLATWRGEGTERECVAETRRIRPSATPHRGLVRFADELLDRGGRLIGALTKAHRS